MPRSLLNLDLLAPAFAVVVLAVAAGVVGYFTAPSGPSDPTLPAPVDPSPHIARGVIQSVGSDSLVLAVEGAGRTLRFSASTPVEALRPVTADALREGTWLNAGAVQHRQTLFALTGLVLLPAGTFEAPAR